MLLEGANTHPIASHMPSATAIMVKYEPVRRSPGLSEVKEQRNRKRRRSGRVQKSLPHTHRPRTRALHAPR